jgi:broad specificity phosphatase PhoE
MSSIPSSDALLLVRHGRTADNAAGLILGHRDPPLSEAGRAEAERLAAELRSSGITAVWTSPLRRAYETAAIVAAPLAVEPRVCADLVESARGRWEGVAVARIARDEPALHAAFERGDPEFTFPGGESLREQQARTRAALAVVAAGPLPAVVVAHAGTIRAVFALSGRPVGPERALEHGAIAARVRIADLHLSAPEG